MKQKHEFIYVNDGILIKVTDAQAAKIIKDAKARHYQLDTTDRSFYRNERYGWQYVTTHFFFSREEDSKLRSFSLFRESMDWEE